LVLAWIAGACALLGGLVHSRGEASNNEYQIKAAFLLNFAKYVKWPERVFPGTSSPIRIAVLGPDPFGKVLDDTLRGKTVGARKIEVRRFKTAQDIAECQILFVSTAESARLSKVLEQCQGKAVLVVGDCDKFAAHGGAIGLYIEDSKVRFEINPEAVKRSELEISSQLMKLARIVKEETGGH
jgi:hypothetical protein